MPVLFFLDVIFMFMIRIWTDSNFIAKIFCQCISNWNSEVLEVVGNGMSFVWVFLLENGSRYDWIVQLPIGYIRQR